MRRASRLKQEQIETGTQQQQANAGSRGKKRAQQALTEQGDGDGAGPQSAQPSCERKKKKQRTDGPTQSREEALWQQGYSSVGGLDEAGRGPLAGPVVAAVCVLPHNPPASLVQGLNDSKLLSEAQRDQLYAEITCASSGVQWAAQVIDHTTIDRINILQASLTAMREASLQLPPNLLDYLLVDGNKVPQNLSVPAEAIVKGDGKCSCIAAASIIAKVTRDRLMQELHLKYPQYNFGQHKGYGVPEHLEALRVHGPCEVHRRSFQPVRGMTGWTREGQLEKKKKSEAAGEKKKKAVTKPSKCCKGESSDVTAATDAALQL